MKYFMIFAQYFLYFKPMDHPNTSKIKACYRRAYDCYQQYKKQVPISICLPDMDLDPGDLEDLSSIINQKLVLSVDQPDEIGLASENFCLDSVMLPYLQNRFPSPDELKKIYAILFIFSSILKFLKKHTDIPRWLFINMCALFTKIGEKKVAQKILETNIDFTGDKKLVPIFGNIGKITDILIEGSRDWYNVWKLSFEEMEKKEMNRGRSSQELNEEDALVRLLIIFSASICYYKPTEVGLIFGFMQQFFKPIPPQLKCLQKLKTIKLDQSTYKINQSSIEQIPYLDLQPLPFDTFLKDFLSVSYHETLKNTDKKIVVLEKDSAKVYKEVFNDRIKVLIVDPKLTKYELISFKKCQKISAFTDFEKVKDLRTAYQQIKANCNAKNYALILNVEQLQDYTLLEDLEDKIIKLYYYGKSSIKLPLYATELQKTYLRNSSRNFNQDIIEMNLAEDLRRQIVRRNPFVLTPNFSIVNKCSQNIDRSKAKTTRLMINLMLCPVNHQESKQLFITFIKNQKQTENNDSNGMENYFTIPDIEQAIRRNSFEEYRKRVILDYTRQSFFYKAVNRLLRSFNRIDYFPYVRYPAAALFLEIRKIYLTQFHREEKTYYRGCYLNQNEKDFLKIKDSIFQSEGFLSASTEQNIVNHYGDCQLKITVHKNTSDKKVTGMAKVKNSAFKGESQTIFNPGNFFRVIKFRQLNESHFKFQVQLELIFVENLPNKLEATQNEKDLIELLEEPYISSEIQLMSRLGMSQKLIQFIREDISNKILSNTGAQMKEIAQNYSKKHDTSILKQILNNFRQEIRSLPSIQLRLLSILILDLVQQSSDMEQEMLMNFYFYYRKNSTSDIYQQILKLRGTILQELINHYQNSREKQFYYNDLKILTDSVQQKFEQKNRRYSVSLSLLVPQYILNFELKINQCESQEEVDQLQHQIQAIYQKYQQIVPFLKSQYQKNKRQLMRRRQQIKNGKLDLIGQIWKAYQNLDYFKVIKIYKQNNFMLERMIESEQINQSILVLMKYVLLSYYEVVISFENTKKLVFIQAYQKNNKKEFLYDLHQALLRLTRILKLFKNKKLLDQKQLQENEQLLHLYNAYYYEEKDEVKFAIEELNSIKTKKWMKLEKLGELHEISEDIKTAVCYFEDSLTCEFPQEYCPFHSQGRIFYCLVRQYEWELAYDQAHAIKKWLDSHSLKNSYYIIQCLEILSGVAKFFSMMGDINSAIQTLKKTNEFSNEIKFLPREEILKFTREWIHILSYQNFKKNLQEFVLWSHLHNEEQINVLEFLINSQIPLQNFNQAMKQLRFLYLENPSQYSNRHRQYFALVLSFILENKLSYCQNKQKIMEIFYSSQINLNQIEHLDIQKKIMEVYEVITEQCKKNPPVLGYDYSCFKKYRQTKVWGLRNLDIRLILLNLEPEIVSRMKHSTQRFYKEWAKQLYQLIEQQFASFPQIIEIARSNRKSLQSKKDQEIKLIPIFPNSSKSLNPMFESAISRLHHNINKSFYEGSEIKYVSEFYENLSKCPYINRSKLFQVFYQLGQKFEEQQKMEKSQICYDYALQVAYLQYSFVRGEKKTANFGKALKKLILIYKRDGKQELQKIYTEILQASMQSQDTQKILSIHKNMKSLIKIKKDLGIHEHSAKKIDEKDMQRIKTKEYFQKVQKLFEYFAQNKEYPEASDLDSFADLCLNTYCVLKSLQFLNKFDEILLKCCKIGTSSKNPNPNQILYLKVAQKYTEEMLKKLSESQKSESNTKMIQFYQSFQGELKQPSVKIGKILKLWKEYGK